MKASPDHATKLLMQGIHLDLTPAMQNIIRDKFSTLLEHNPYIVRLHVRLQQDQTFGQNHLYRANGQIEIGGPDLVASAVGQDAYVVLDELVDRLDRQLEKRHGRRKVDRNHPHPTELDDTIPKSGRAAEE